MHKLQGLYKLSNNIIKYLLFSHAVISNSNREASDFIQLGQLPCIIKHVLKCDEVNVKKKIVGTFACVFQESYCSEYSLSVS